MKTRKRRRQPESTPAGQAPAGAAGVYRPFRELRDLLPAPAAPPPPPPPPPRPRRAPAEPDERAFASAMAGVAPLGRPDAAPRAPGPPAPPDDEFAVAERFLAGLVDGEVPFDLADTDEYVEGGVRGIAPSLVRRLRDGAFALEAHLDLHGLDRHEAKSAVRDFIERARSEGRRCVLLVHGRGLGSKEGVPVLKERLREWLTRGGIGRKVLAFASARPCDGGTGALYVLLRR